MIDGEFKPNRKKATYVSLAMGTILFIVSIFYNSLLEATVLGVAASITIKLLDEFQIWLAPKLLSRILKKYAQHRLVITRAFRIDNCILIGEIDGTEIYLRPFVNGSFSVLFELTLDISKWKTKPSSWSLNTVFGRKNYHFQANRITISDWSVLWNASNLNRVIARVTRIIHEVKNQDKTSHQ